MCAQQIDVRQQLSWSRRLTILNTFQRNVSIPCGAPVPSLVNLSLFVLRNASYKPRGTMCVTEVWSYRECGCNYNHSVLCRTYHDQKSPSFAPNIQYPLERWLREAGMDTEMAYKQLSQRVWPREPQDCPNHNTVHKSFLNQICEDCLLAELEAQPRNLDDRLTITRSPAAEKDNGEGLIWDSEVKIEIEDHTSITPMLPILPEIFDHANVFLEEDDKRILESHVEVTVEPDGHSVSVGDLSSPMSTASQGSDRSASSSPETTPQSGGHVKNRRSSSPTCHGKRYKRAFENDCPDFDDADDELGRNGARSLLATKPLSRGRPLKRSNLHNVEWCEPDMDSRLKPTGTKTGAAVGRFHGLRSLSTTFLSAKIESEDAEIDQNSKLDRTSAAASSTSKSKNPFRSIRSRKGSPLVQGTSVLGPTPSNGLSGKVTANHVADSEVKGVRPIPPRKSSLKNFALFLMQDLKRTRNAQSQSGSLVPSPTSTWDGSHVDIQKGKEPDAHGSASHPDTILEKTPGWISLASESTLCMKTDERPLANALNPGIPKSSTMNTLRAVINDLDVGIDHHDGGISHGWISTNSHIDDQPADAPAVKNYDIPEVWKKESVQHQNHAGEKLKFVVRPPRSSSLQSLGGHALTSHPVLARNITATRLNTGVTWQSG